MISVMVFGIHESVWYIYIKSNIGFSFYSVLSLANKSNKLPSTRYERKQIT